MVTTLNSKGNMNKSIFEATKVSGGGVLVNVMMMPGYTNKTVVSTGNNLPAYEQYIFNGQISTYDPTVGCSYHNHGQRSSLTVYNDVTITFANPIVCESIRAYQVMARATANVSNQNGASWQKNIWVNGVDIIPGNSGGHQPNHYSQDFIDNVIRSGVSSIRVYTRATQNMNNWTCQACCGIGEIEVYTRI